MAKSPELHIEIEDYLYIKEAVSKAGFREVGGLGIIVMEDGRPTVRHMRLLKQTISSGEVDWSEEAHSEYLTWLYTPEADGGAGFEGESYGLYSWHSHGNMNVFWSGTDEDFIRRVGLTAPYIFSSVFNNKNEVKHRLDVWSQLDCEMLAERPRQQITWQHDQIELAVIPHADAKPIADEALDKELAVEVEIEKIKEEAKKLIEEFEKQIADKRKELEEEIKPLHLALKEIHKAATEDVKSRLDADYKEYVSLFQYNSQRPTTGTSGPGTAGGTSSGPKAPGGGGGTGSRQLPVSTSTTGEKPNGKQGGKKGKDGSKDGTKEHDGTGTPVQSDANTYRFDEDGQLPLGFREHLYYRAYDSTAQHTSVFSLKQILDDNDIIIIQEIPEKVIALLTHDEKMAIDLRKRYQEYLSDMIAQNRDSAHSYRGGYA